MVDTAESGAIDPVLARFLLRSGWQQLEAADSRTPQELADAAGVSLKTWKRWMGGQNAGWNKGQVIMAASAFGYGDKDTVTLQLQQLAVDARKNNVVARPEWVRSSALDLLVALEDVADEIRNYELTIIPGLLQTRDYARGHLEQVGYSGAELEERVELRMTRQRRIEQDLVAYVAVIDEAVLHRSPTKQDVMARQLEHLLGVSKWDHVEIRVIPFSAGPYPTDGNGPFAQVRSERVGRTITCVETSLSSTYLETVEANERYGAAWAELADRALAPDKSAEMIRDLLTRSTPR